jgi:hypothetical protein
MKKLVNCKNFELKYNLKFLKNLFSRFKYKIFVKFIYLLKLDDWKRFKEGFLNINHIFKPKEIIDLKICDLADKDIAFYMP